MLFGLTGGIASGKSTVAGIMRTRTVAIIDADQIAREVVAPGSSGLQSVVEQFGPTVIGLNGRLDRRVLGALVFNDRKARARLNSITHPLIREASMQRARQLAAEGALLIAYEAALLVEVGHADSFRPLVVVAVPEAVQLQRLMQRDGLDEQQARARLTAQMPLAQKVSVADHVIDASGTMQQTSDRTDDVLRKLCYAAGVDGATIGL
jgi:dephospho-CoA kinase